MGLYLQMQPNEDKRLLIESMKKLSSHISSNANRQLDIFRSLALPDLTKIITNLTDTNEALRRVSALLLCELTFNNEPIKKNMAQMLAVLPAQGRICLSGFSSAMLRQPSLLKDCVELMKKQPQHGEEQKMCWFISLERKNCHLEFLDYKQYTTSTFIDPATHIFGFTLPLYPRPPTVHPHPTTSSLAPTSPLTPTPINHKYRYSQTATTQLKAKTNRLQKTFGQKDTSSGPKNDKPSDSYQHNNSQNKPEETIRSDRPYKEYNYVRDSVMNGSYGNKTTRHFPHLATTLNSTSDMLIQDQTKIHLTPVAARHTQDCMTDRHKEHRDIYELRPTYIATRSKY